MEQFFIFDYLNQALCISVITCDKTIHLLINVAGLQQFGNTAFNSGQPYTAERAAAVEDAPMFFAAPLPRVTASRGEPAQRMVCSHLGHARPAVRVS